MNHEFRVIHVTVGKREPTPRSKKVIVVFEGKNRLERSSIEVQAGPKYEGHKKLVDKEKAESELNASSG